MVWYGMVGMVWYGMVWYGMVWNGMGWNGMGWDGMSVLLILMSGEVSVIELPRSSMRDLIPCGSKRNAISWDPQGIQSRRITSTCNSSLTAASSFVSALISSDCLLYSSWNGMGWGEMGIK